jgi:endonuclease/exonuclease/phosphatase family metal-dependent hydrolase
VSDQIILRIRTWNIAHGRDVPPMREGYRHVRRKHLGAMAQLMTEGGPDVLLLQEVPVGVAADLHRLTGMAITLAPAYGAHIPFLHVPLPTPVGAAIGRALPDLVRTQIEGQANAALFGDDLLMVSARRAQLNEHRRLRGEPRIIQLVRLRHRRSGQEVAIGNVHLDPGDNREQVERAGYLLERFARGAPMVLAGDMNATAAGAGIRALIARGWEHGGRDLHVDHIFVRGCRFHTEPRRWDAEQRDIYPNGSLPVRLSDHDPVDAEVACST